MLCLFWALSSAAYVGRCRLCLFGVPSHLCFLRCPLHVFGVTVIYVVSEALLSYSAATEAAAFGYPRAMIPSRRPAYPGTVLKMIPGTWYPGIWNHAAACSFGGGCLVTRSFHQFIRCTFIGESYRQHLQACNINHPPTKSQLTEHFSAAPKQQNYLRVPTTLSKQLIDSPREAPGISVARSQQQHFVCACSDCPTPSDRISPHPLPPSSWHTASLLNYCFLDHQP